MPGPLSRRRKGNTSNISVIAQNECDWEFLRRVLTPERVLLAFAHLAAGPVRRSELPNLKAFNFAIENALAGGVTISIAQDIYGKRFSTVMLSIELPDRDRPWLLHTVDPRADT